MNVALYARKVLEHEVPFFQLLFKELENQKWNVTIEDDFYIQLKEKINLTATYSTFNHFSDFQKGIDLAISIGGDGTFLKTVTYVRDSGVPIIGINTGRLGFLSDTKTTELKEVLSALQAKEYTYQQRSLIKVETEDNLFDDQNFALNEVAVHKKDRASLITVEAYLGDKYINAYNADGLLVGTPTGSTAYSLSCGGPIITPGCGVHFVTPIAAHNLNVRPLIVPDNIPVKLKVMGRDRQFLVTLDSLSKSVRSGTEITICRSDFMINVIKFNDSNFFKTIRNKLLWGIDQRVGK